MTIATVSAVVGLLGPVHDPGLLAELLAHLLDDLAAGAADSLDRERREQVDHDAADQEPDQNRRIGDRERAAVREELSAALFLSELDLECLEQHERREHGRTDRVALRDGLRRVADRVERVGDVADLLGQLRHLGDAARVVRDRTESVERDDQAGQRKLGDDGDRDAVDAGELVCAQDRQRQDERRGSRALEALCEALDDVGRVPGLGRLGDRANGTEAG